MKKRWGNSLKYRKRKFLMCDYCHKRIKRGESFSVIPVYGKDGFVEKNLYFHFKCSMKWYAKHKKEYEGK